jgi:hypothetical protein
MSCLMMALVRRNMWKRLTKHHNKVLILTHLLIFMYTKMLGPAIKIHFYVTVLFKCYMYLSQQYLLLPRFKGVYNVYSTDMSRGKGKGKGRFSGFIRH